MTNTPIIDNLIKELEALNMRIGVDKTLFSDKNRLPYRYANSGYKLVKKVKNYLPK